MTRLAVTADVHADDFGSKVDAATGLNARWVDTVGMLRWVAEDARDRGCDALVIAGDLTESRHPAPWRVAQIGEALEAFGGPVILARGNHDGLRAGRSVVDVLAAGRPTWHGFSKPGIVVVGSTAVAVLPYLDQHHLRSLESYGDVAPAEAYRILGDAFLDLARGLHVQAAAVASRVVLVIHQGLSGGSMSDSQRAFLGDQSLVVDTRALGAIGFDAVLAGHFHLHQVLSTDPLIAYAGSPYRTDFGEELQVKGYAVVDIGDGRADLTFVETPARRFVTIDAAGGVPEVDANIAGAVVRVLDVDPAADTAAIRQQLEGHGAFDVAEIRRRPVTGTTGAGGLSEGLTPTQALQAYFAEDADRDAILERGRALLEEVA